MAPPRTKRSEELMKEFLLPHFKRLCLEPEANVRLHVASVFHEFAQSLKHDSPLLIDSFIDLCNSGDPEVINCLANHLEEILECIYGENGAKSAYTDTSWTGHNVNVVHPAYARLVRTLLSCNCLVRNGSQWRCQEQLLASYSCLSRFLPKEQLCHVFVPMIKEEVLTARALPCRLAALRTLVVWTGELRSSSTDVQAMVAYCTNSLAGNRSCHKRILFLDACEMSIELISKDFFKTQFFQAAIKLADDPVLNVRMKFCKLLPLFKRAFVPAAEAENLIAIEKAAQALMQNDNKGHMGEIVKKAISEMAHADAVDMVITASQNNNQSSMKDRSKPVIRNSSAPMPTRTLPRVLWAVSAFKDGLSRRNKEETTDSIDDAGNSTASFNGESKMGHLQRESLGDVHRRGSQGHTDAQTLTRVQLENDGGSSSTASTWRNGKPENSNEKRTMDNAEKTPGPKKVAIVYPTKVAIPSSSPQPTLRPLNPQMDMKSEHDITGTNDNRNYAPAAFSGGASDGEFVDSNVQHLLHGKPNLITDGKENRPNERIVPIRLVGESSNYRWSNVRPATPHSFRRLSFASASLPRRSTMAGASVRNIPVVRTGAVMKSVGKFESGAPLSK